MFSLQIPQSPYPCRIFHIIYPILANPDPPFVDYAGHNSSACPIRRPPQSSVSYGNQDSTVQEFFSYKYDQRVWWDAINVVAATIPPTTSGLTPSLKLFLHSVAPFLFYRPSIWTPQHSNGLIGFGYDTWYYYLIWSPVPYMYDTYNFTIRYNTIHTLYRVIYEQLRYVDMI